jgi:Zn-dependent peptidase ImmA (M78 family)
MISHEALAKQTTHAALRLRVQLGRRLEDAVCPYDLAEEIGVSLRFMAVSSLEGMYRAGRQPLVIVNSLRPAGRRAFNCAHELGHHAFNHGTCVDELLERDEEEERRDPKEFMANRFAAALLMPKVAVERAFASRGWNARTPSPEQVYIVATYLGVGYATLISYLQGTLLVMTRAHATGLRRFAPKEIRATLVGRRVPHDLIVVDEQWTGRPIDLEVGDLVQLPPECVLSGPLLDFEAGDPTSPRLARAIAPGITQFSLCGRRWAVPIRVVRREYVGLARHRYLEEEDDV